MTLLNSFINFTKPLVTLEVFLYTTMYTVSSFPFFLIFRVFSLHFTVSDLQSNLESYLLLVFRGKNSMFHHQKRCLLLVLYTSLPFPSFHSWFADMLFYFFIEEGFDLYSVVLRIYHWFCAQGSPLAVCRESYEDVWMKLGSATCKLHTLSSVIYQQFYY